MKYIRATIILSGVLILCAVAIIEGMYHYVISEIQPEITLTGKPLPAQAKEIVWVASGESGEMKIEPMTLSWFIAEVILINAYGDHSGWAVYLPQGHKITSLLSRQITFVNERVIGNYFDRVAVSIWLGRTLNSDQILTAYLEDLYLGREVNGIHQAAEYYFKKPAIELDTNEITSLMVIARSPARYHAKHNPEEFQQSAERLVTNLKANWSDQFGNYVFRKPEFYDN